MFRVVVFSIFVALILQGCASPKVSVGMLMPARFDQVSQYRRIAVLPFKGPDGRDMAQKVEARLVSVRVKEKPWFDVYERERLKTALRELRLGSSGLVDSTTAAKIGRFIGVKGVYIGVVNKLDVDIRNYRESRRYCAEENKKGKCLRWKDRTVRCRRKYAVIEFTPRMVDVETAHVVYSRLITRSWERSACDNAVGSLPGNSSMLGVVKQEALMDFIKDVAPYLQHQDISIKTDTDDLQGRAKAFFEAGVAFSKEDRLDRGCQLLEKALQAGGGSLSLYYNLGVCAETRGNFEQASQWFHKADQLLMKPDKEVSQALRRMQSKRDARRKLQKQLQ